MKKLSKWHTPLDTPIIILVFAEPQKSDHIVTNHGVNRKSVNDTEWFQANGFFNGGLTTIRSKSNRTVYYNQIQGDLAHSSIFDENNNLLLLNEVVINGGIYRLTRSGDDIFLDQQGF